MVVRTLRSMAVAALLLSTGGVALAASELAPVTADNPYLDKIEKATREIGEKLPEPALKHLYYIREGFGASRVVLIVRKDVDAAVKACGKANPDMKSDMNAGFSAWTAKVDPVVKEKQALMNQAIDKQDYIKPKEIRDYLKLIEQAGEHANSQIDKQIVVTPEACRSLLQSMTKTADVVTKLLADVQFLVWPLSDEDKKASPVKKTGAAD